MSTFILVLVVGFLIQDVTSNEGILSKLHQNGYKLKDMRFQLITYDKETFNKFEIKAFKYNRTTTAHNGTWNFKIDTKDDIEVLIQTHKFLSNEYRHFPIRLQLNLKKSFDSNALGLNHLRRCGNDTSFYFHKDITYHACDFVVDEKHFPPLIPNGKFRIDLTLFYFDKEIALVYLFCEVYIPIPYPK